MSATTERFLDFMVAERGASPHTRRAYAADLADLEGMVGHPAETADLAELRRWLATKAGAASSMARRIACVRTFFRWAQREGVLTDSPAERLRTPKVRRPLPRVLAVDEANEVVDAPVGGGWRMARNRALLEVAYGAGLRVAELAGLDLGDLDLQADRVFVRQGKGGKDRIAPMGRPASEALRAWIGVRTSDSTAVFVNDRGARLSTRSMWQIVRNSGVKHGLSEVHPHAFRHTFATHLLRGGADIRSIQEMMGHSSLSTTQRYATVDLEQLQRTWEDAHPHGRRR